MLRQEGLGRRRSALQAKLPDSGRRGPRRGPLGVPTGLRVGPRPSGASIAAREIRNRVSGIGAVPDPEGRPRVGPLETTMPLTRPASSRPRSLPPILALLISLPLLCGLDDPPAHADAASDRRVVADGDAPRPSRLEAAARLIADEDLSPRERAWAHIRRGRLLRIDDAYAESIADFRAALALDPDDPQTERDIAISMYWMDDYAGAEAHLGRAIELDPRNWYGWFLRARVRVQQDKDAEADADFSRALEAASAFGERLRRARHGAQARRRQRCRPGGCPRRDRDRSVQRIRPPGRGPDLRAHAPTP